MFFACFQDALGLATGLAWAAPPEFGSGDQPLLVSNAQDRKTPFILIMRSVVPMLVFPGEAPKRIYLCGDLPEGNVRPRERELNPPVAPVGVPQVSIHTRTHTHMHYTRVYTHTGTLRVVRVAVHAFAIASR